MWKASKNTYEIAEKLGVHEACVSRVVPEIVKACHIEKVKAA
jgi:predicted transcriptional regulator